MGFIEGTSGKEISLLVGGIKVMAIQSLTWKSSQSKSLIRGAGYPKAHGIGRGPKEYAVDFEVKELNKALLETAINATISSEKKLNKFQLDGVEYKDLLDLRDLTILVMHPLQNNVRKTAKFTGFEFTDVEGSFALDDEAVGRTLSGIATDAEGLI